MGFGFSGGMSVKKRGICLPALQSMRGNSAICLRWPERSTTGKAYLFLERSFQKGSGRMEKEDMEITPERAEKIKRALIRQYEDQYGVEVVGYREFKGENREAPA